MLLPFTISSCSSFQWHSLHQICQHQWYQSTLWNVIAKRNKTKTTTFITELYIHSPPLQAYTAAADEPSTISALAKPVLLYIFIARSLWMLIDSISLNIPIYQICPSHTNKVGLVLSHSIHYDALSGWSLFTRGESCGFETSQYGSRPQGYATW